MNWTAMRVFAGREPSGRGIIAGVALWRALCQFPVFYQSIPIRVLVFSVLAFIYYALAALELWKTHKTLAVTFLPALLLTLLHATFYGVRSVVDQSRPIEEALSGLGDGARFFSFMSFESMLYVLGIAYLTLAMLKERAELRFKAAPFSDSLTGIGNGRAFMELAEQLVASSKGRSDPVALLLCDQDHFKHQNDTSGHAAGDQALIAFGQILVECLRKEHVFGRIGGEEFACLLANQDQESAVNVADRIRSAIAALSNAEKGLLSVSIGVVTSQQKGYQLSRFLLGADKSLYSAKNAGRNRVTAFSPSASLSRNSPSD